MMKYSGKVFLLTAMLALWAVASSASGGLAVASSDCLECHEESIEAGAYADSVHGQNACSSCHVEVTDVDSHLDGAIEIQAVQCSRCHKDVAQQYQAGVHFANGVECSACHSDIHTQGSGSGAKDAVAQRCGECHDVSDYMASVHGQAVASGNEDGATCSDCHGLHGIAAIGEQGSQQKHTFLSEACICCHQDHETMQRNGVFTGAVETYLESYHGKSYRLGSPENGAGCSDCHGAHGVLPRSDEGSTLSGENLVTTCGQCHENATSLFTQYYAHGDHSDAENYPVLYWTFMAMTGLLVGTFAVFWIHTLLWMFRGFVENRQRQEEYLASHGLARPAEVAVAVSTSCESASAGALDASLPAYGAGGAGVATRGEALVAEGHKVYRRFQKRHIYLHLTVIISFLGLSLTGLPLKFSDQAWAGTMMSFFGGVHYAGLIHRGCAVLTFYYFAGSLVMSFDFLFLRKDVKGIWLQRMFGPDSLMPNFRDARDVKAMVKWFFFRGPKPTFERWTYWEKFDFLAVFWGMFAIGGSGLLLWFPEFFGGLLPGWLFNVATIIHSDEALLATGFIFTVHFFNTHGRPEKFPMDFVIFNGEIDEEEFIEERGDQWKRYQEDGVLEHYEVGRRSGVLYDFFFKGFGFVAVFTGLTLAFLMISAFLKG